MSKAHRSRIALGAGLIGTVVAFGLLLPLPLATDIYAARRWGVGAGYVGFVLGFPLGIIGVPALVAIRPFPAGNDASGSSMVATMVAVLVGLNWAGVTFSLTTIITRLRLGYPRRPR
jgi:hypothetical protein